MAAPVGTRASGRGGRAWNVRPDRTELVQRLRWGGSVIDPTTNLVMRMHRAGPGACWADSDHLPGFTAAGEDFAAVMGQVWSALEQPTAVRVTLAEVVDLRWQWCDDPSRGVAAVTPATECRMFGAERPRVCPCEMREA